MRTKTQAYSTIFCYFAQNPVLLSLPGVTRQIRRGLRNLRVFTVEMALELSGVNFAAGKSHGLEDFFEAESGLLIRLFSRAREFVAALFRGVLVLFSHGSYHTQRLALKSGTHFRRKYTKQANRVKVPIMVQEKARSRNSGLNRNSS